MVRVCILVLFLIATVDARSVERRVDGNRTTEDVPEIPAAVMARSAQYSHIRAASLRDWHPSGDALLIGTQLGSTTQLYLVSQPLGMRSQLTFFEEPVAGGAFPRGGNGREIVFRVDVGGNENHTAYGLNVDDGRLRRLTPDDSQARTVLWSNSGRQFVYQSNRDDPTRFDVWIAAADDPDSARMLVEGTGFYWYPTDWSPDDSKVIVLQIISAVSSRPFIVDVETGEMTRIGPDDVKADYWPAVFSGDGESVYLATDLGSEFTRLARYDVSSGELNTLVTDIEWGVSDIVASTERDLIAFTTNEDGISHLYFLNPRDDSIRRVTTVPAGVIGNMRFAPRDHRLAFAMSTARAPWDVYVYDPDDDSLERWTESEVGGLNRDEFVDAELMHYPTFDEVDGKPREIPAFIYRPASGPTKGPFPVLIQIHGGPEGQTKPTFYANAQKWVNELGLVVIRPNVRGSAGYGKSYLDLDNGLKREDSVRDIGALLDWIETQPDLDPDRVGVLGASYGGYMVLASMTHYNDRIRAGVEYVGVTNFATFLRNTSDYRRDHRRQEYGDERIPEIFEFLNRTAPANNMHKVDKPLIVLAGANDPRVPASESEQIVRAVRQNEGEVWYVLFDNEGHGFRKQANRIYSGAAVTTFLQKYLLQSE